jgi:APA family basic amino acid/polyamine antiporter
MANENGAAPASNVENRVLKREIGLPECVTIIAGAVIGVGLFTVGSNQVGVWGTSVIIASVISVIITVFPSALYGEMAAALPLAGGTYAYAKRAINYPVGIFVSWNYTVAQIGIAVAEGLAFANYLNMLISACGGPKDMFDPRFSGSVLVLIFVIINFFGIKVAGRAQNAFMYFFWVGSVIWFIISFKNIDFNNYTGLFEGIPPTVSQTALGILMVLWCFFGFETVVGMGAEVKHARVTIPRALILSPFIVLAVNSIWWWFLNGITPAVSRGELTAADAPYAEALQLAGIGGGILIFMCLIITLGGDFSSMNPLVTGAARYMYLMSNDGSLPKAFGKLHPKFKSPYISVIVIGAISIALILTNDILQVALMCAYAQISCYVLGYVSFIMLRIKEPNLERPWKVKAGIPLAVIAIVVYIVLAVLAYDPAALPWNLGFDVLCIIYIIVHLVILKHPIPEESKQIDDLTLKFPAPTPEEKKKLDRQFHRWIGIAIAAAIFSIGLYVVSGLI